MGATYDHDTHVEFVGESARQMFFDRFQRLASHETAFVDLHPNQEDEGVAKEVRPLTAPSMSTVAERAPMASSICFDNPIDKFIHTAHTYIFRHTLRLRIPPVLSTPHSVYISVLPLKDRLDSFSPLLLFLASSGTTHVSIYSGIP